MPSKKSDIGNYLSLLDEIKRQARYESSTTWRCRWRRTPVVGRINNAGEVIANQKW
jgi:hypothetical protein